MAEGRLGNYSSCCRLCLSDKYSILKPMFEDDADNRTLVQRIYNLLGVEVSSSDKVSTMICDQCQGKVNGWHDFKKECSDNQAKLQEWLADGQDEANLSVQVKDEPVDCEESQRSENADEPQSVVIKSESNIEDYYDLPASLHEPDITLQEQDCEEGFNASFNDGLNGTMEMGKRKDSKHCSFCNKMFSTVGNRMKHERIIHSNRRKFTNQLLLSAVTTSQDDSSQQSMDSAVSSSAHTEASVAQFDSENDHSENTESDIQKIQFAAGLRLKQKSTTVSNQFIDGPLTKMELAYLDRSKAMVAMLFAFKCACHNVAFPTIKRLFAHLRMSYTWFPIFTCYNCVITFSNRSLSMRHTGKCSKQYLENIVKLSELCKRMETKVRIYQYCKCMKCENLYAFYEDYCDHIDKEHMSEGPYICLCSKEFGSVEEFKAHLYNGCYLNYYCDICYNSFESLNDFRTHCETEHDHVDDFSFLELHPAFELVSPDEVAAVSNKRSYDEIESPDIKTSAVEIEQARKKMMRSRGFSEPLECEMCDRRFTNPFNLKKHMRSHRKSHGVGNGWKNCPSSCDKCGKVFSTYYNMLRHYKVHDESERNLQCALCTERFRLVSQLKDHLILVHGRANVCQECGKQFESVEELDQHRSVHLNIKVYRDSKTHSYRTGSKPKHNCEICESSFETEDELSEHVRMHDTMPVLDIENGPENVEVEEKKVFGKYSCYECDRHYVSYKGLWLHNKRHHPNRKPAPQNFQCKYCDRVLQTNAAYQMHKQMHERMLRQSSGAVAPTVKRREEEDDDYHTCKHCFKVFSTKYNLKTHLKTHGIYVSPGRTYSKTGKFVKTFWCDTCHQACQGYAELQKHKQEHVQERMQETQNPEEEPIEMKPQIFLCDICTKGFTSKLALNKHKEKHDEENTGPQKRAFVYCKYCKIPYLNVESLNTHMQAEHDEVLKIQKPKAPTKKFVCNICRKMFDTSGALCSHQGWHKRGKAEKVLKNHYYAKPIKEVPRPRLLPISKHECTSCSLVFLTDTALQIHILEAHRNINATVMPPRCTLCNLEFSSQEEYESHSRLHRVTDSQKAYPCKYCSKGFSRSDVLNAHIRQFHNEHLQTSFRCHHCDRIFEKQNALTIHLKVHERQKLTGVPMKQPPSGHRYKCSICHVGFDVPKDLKNHIILSHPF